ncbi:MAG TPA: RNA methyltransferase [Deltaproteobacteria bacterium]|nr:RNA methyltransferase [Deltaproteobacteria bacterium]
MLGKLNSFHKKMASFSVILVRPLFSGNLGSVARAMKNMGLKDLRLVNPQADPAELEARKMAAHAQDVLKRARRFPDLKAAVANFDWVVGTSRRKGKERSNWTTPREFASSSLEFTPRAKVAMVFGPEDSGLLNEDVALCQKMIHIPSHTAFPSLNLAQAVMVTAYELFLAKELGKRAKTSESSSSRPAKVETLEAMYEDLGLLLAEIGFLNQQNPRHLMRLLRHLFNRARTTDKEARIFRGICRQVRWWKFH